MVYCCICKVNSDNDSNAPCLSLSLSTFPIGLVFVEKSYFEEQMFRAKTY
jgi:hypothetical protein